jgi:hypothetical protein
MGATCQRPPGWNPRKTNREARSEELVLARRARLNFANAASALALFVALGGTSYAAATLPFNSVGKGQIKPNAVGKSEAAARSIGTSELRNGGVTSADIKTGAVGASEVRANAIDSDELADKGIKSADIADDAKAELTAANGVTFRAGAKGDGTGAVGNAKAISRASAGVYSVDLGKDVSACQVSATIAGSGATPGFVTVTPGATTNVLTVNTFDPGSVTAADRPFNLLVAC